jgi:glutathione S-transferase
MMFHRRWLKLLCVVPLVLAIPSGCAWSPPSWSDLRSSIVPSQSPPLCIDWTQDHPSVVNTTDDIPVLVRERHGWCHFSARVWLAMELKGIPHYHTYLLESRGDTYDGADDDDDTTGSYRRPAFFPEKWTLPRLQLPGLSHEWLGADTEEELLELLQMVEEYFSDQDPPLFPSNRVWEVATAFPGCLPTARASRRAAWLFSAQEGYRLDALPQSTFERVLDQAEALLAKNDDGPFFCGASITAADIVWTPLLERYAVQLPCLHRGLSPRGSSDRWPWLQQWYQAMDTVPAYVGRIQGDAPSWRKVLYRDPWWPRADLWHPRDTVGPKGELQATEAECIQAFGGGVEDEESSTILWSQFASKRPYVASTPGKEAASGLVRNHKAILVDAANWMDEEGYEIPSDEDLDTALRQIVVLLSTNGEVQENNETIVTLLTYLDNRLCVPRDMGILPATSIRKLFRTANAKKGG